MIDTHCHLSLLSTRDLDADAELSHCAAAGFRAVLDVGIDVEDFQTRADRAARWNGVWLSAGLYPSHAAREDFRSWLPEALAQLRPLLSHTRVCAIGELGFDRHWNYGNPDLQAELVAPQVELSGEFGLPLILHNREADQDIRRAFPEGPPAGGILHCFSGDREFASWALERGFHLGFGGNTTFRRNTALRELLKWVPMDRVLLETDAPWLAPEPHRGKPNRPLNTVLVYQLLADIRGLSVPELTDHVARNAAELFGIPEDLRLNRAGEDRF